MEYYYGKVEFLFGMAENDMQYAKACISAGQSIGNFNVVASLCAQAGEKYLKAVIECEFLNDPDALSLMHSHNLRALYNRVIKKYPMSVDSRSCKWLGDFYYDARIPGDNFVEVNEQDANECLSIVDKIKTDVQKIFSERDKADSNAKESLEKLKAF